MDVSTVTTSDHGLLRAVRQVLSESEEVLLCVAFAHPRGVHLIEEELALRQRERLSTRLLVTTVFQQEPALALSMARSFGVEARILNLGSGHTFHPKLYLGSKGAHARAVIGSANLTGGLFSNYEAAVALAGRRDDAPLAEAWRFAEAWWNDRRAEHWAQVPIAAERDEGAFDAALYASLVAEVERNPVFMTLGASPRKNLVAAVTRSEVQVVTERSRERRGGAEAIPAWMFNVAWDRLRTHGRLTNVELLSELRVHRSSAVCAILARLPGVQVEPGARISLRWAQGVSPRHRSS